MIECRLKGGPLNGHVKLVDAALVAYGVVYFTVTMQKPDALAVGLQNKAVKDSRLAYRVKSANSETAVLEFSE